VTAAAPTEAIGGNRKRSRGTAAGQPARCASRMAPRAGQRSQANRPLNRERPGKWSLIDGRGEGRSSAAAAQQHRC
jgi:hypothetical protein